MCESYVWELDAAGLDLVLTELAAQGVGADTRRKYLGELVRFHRFLTARKSVEIERLFGVRIEGPVDEFNECHHVANDSSAMRPPPTVERMDAFFDFLRDRIGTARKYAPAARDYALFRTLFHAGLRSEESVSLERSACTSRGVPSARSTSASARGPGRRAHGHGGCRCSTVLSSSWVGSSMMSVLTSATGRRCSATRLVSP